jgi:hypothetical protein
MSIRTKCPPLQIAWTHDMAADAQAEVKTRERADTPQNAILLRADIHTLFDDYQWSLWVCQISVTHSTFSN